MRKGVVPILHRLTAVLLLGVLGSPRASRAVEAVPGSVRHVPRPASLHARTASPSTSALVETGRRGWYQEGHDAQHTGYSSPEIPLPWTFQWQWNGSCDAPIGSDCRPGDPEEGWAFEIPAKSHLVTGHGKLYLPAGEHGVWAIRAADGQTAWYNGEIESYCSAAFDPDTSSLLVASSDGRLYKLDPDNGNVISSFQAASGLNLAPTIASGRVYVVSDAGVLYAADKDTMEVDWSYPAGSPGQTPAAYSITHNLLVFGTEDLYVHAVNDADGSMQWRTKPTPNSPGPLSYDGGDGKSHRAYNYEHGWPVIAEDHGVVFVRLRLPKAAMWSVPGPANWFPTSNAAIRSFLTTSPELQTLFALDLDDGSMAFVPAVGTGGVETPDLDSTLGPLPVVRKLDNGDEVAYIVWRNGQKCEAGDCSDPRWDAVMGEMVLDNTTVPGYQAGDCRFVRFHSLRDTLITDEMGKLSMAGDTLFHAHWLALYAYDITNRSVSLGATYGNPIRTEQRYSIINRASNEPAWVTCQPTADHFCARHLDSFGDVRVFDDGFWAFFNASDPPYEACSGYNCVGAYSDGYKARYAIIDGGTIYYELNGGTIFAVQSAADPDASVDKSAIPVAPSRGATVTYSLRIVGNGLSLTLADSVPAGLGSPGPIASSQGVATYDAGQRLIIWNGSPAFQEAVSIEYSVPVQVDGPLALVNTVVVTDSEGHESSDAAMVIVDAYEGYLPLVIRY